MTTPDVIKTSVYEYTHPDRLGRVILLGTVHVAMPSYFDTVQKKIQGYEHSGAVVHYEGVSAPTPETLRAASPALARRAERLNATLEGLQTLYRQAAPLVYQGDAIIPGGAWQNHDATHLDIAAQMTDEHVEEIGGKTDELLSVIRTMESFAGLFPEAQQEFSRSFTKGMVESIMSADSPSNPLGLMAHETLAYRNAIQMQAIDEHITHCPQTDLVAVWGEEHLPGFSTAVVDRCYTEIDRQSLIAVDLSTL
jgi:hypothetical protein